jgi:2Fe-2S ferredoxin
LYAKLRTRWLLRIKPNENEEDLLDRAWGLNPQSRLSCQAIVAHQDLVIEIPKYSINHAKENH